ncbi:MAG: hypothetical protein IPG99_02225 [Ignavibacteria bacterium]|nr:hypothetical protein [Ignavibacteria bacterium]
MKKISITAVLVIALIATLAFNETISSKANSDPLPLPAFNIRVMQYGGTTPQQGAQVLYYLGSSLQYDGRTDANGWCNITLQAGTYNIYVYYPPQPNDGCSGSLLNFYHDSNDNETIVLGPEYR